MISSPQRGVLPRKIEHGDGLLTGFGLPPGTFKVCSHLDVISGIMR